MRQKDGFQPMELDFGDSFHSSRSNDNNRWSSGFRRRRLANSEISICFRSGMICLSIVLLIGVVIVYKKGENALSESGLFPEKNGDKWNGDTLKDGNENKNSYPDFSSDASPDPPRARRDDNRRVQLGIAPPGWDPNLPRQSEASSNPLMDPPKLIPDPYGWMRDDNRTAPEILEHLYEENNYTKSRLRHLEPLQDSLYNEMMGYIDETSHSVPFFDRSYFYYRRTIEGQPYYLHCRAPKPSDDSTNLDDKFAVAKYIKKHLTEWNGSSDAPILPGEDVYLDENMVAKGQAFFNLGDLQISPSENLMAYTVDFSGNELYEMIIQQIDSKEIVFEGGDSLIISDELEWGPNDDVLFYGKLDEAQRTFQIYRRNLRAETEELLYEELDETFWVGFSVTSDNKYLVIQTSSWESSEAYYLDISESASTQDTQLVCIAKRQDEVSYSVEHFHGTWWILSNINDPQGDMELWTVPVGHEAEGKWSRVVDPNSQNPILNGIAISGFSPFDQHIVVEGREDGMQRLWILAMEPSSSVTKCERLDFSTEAAHTISFGTNVDFNTTALTVNYVSLVTPSQVIQVDLNDANNIMSRVVIYQNPVPGYRRSEYGCQRVEVLSRDGHSQIPVSLVYRESTLEKAETRGEKVPIHLYAYGAYGDSMDDTFSSTRLSLLDRGMIYAIAHVRGGGEKGRPWYQDGKLLNKYHTFNDFVDVGRYFVQDKQWTSPSLLSCEGRSAGGLTIGASLNQAPELFRAAILGVPFVDLVVTMMDASIPLTAGEWEEWGNPNEAEYYDSMMAYSPMNNVKATLYPSMLLLAGLYDPRVAFWEPAKFTATLRYTADENDYHPICLKTDMTSGHFSASDRYKSFREKAFEYAFVLNQLGIA